MDITLKVATLNFTGISFSPFEYHDGSKDKQQIDTIFLELVKQNTQFNEESFTWDTGKIDVNIQRERYSPVYRSQMGTIRGKLVNKQQFDLLWDHYFELASHKLAKNPPTEHNIARMKLFDWLAYLTLVKYSYGNLDIQRIKEYDVKIFQQKLKQWFSKAYLETKPKIDKVIEYLNEEKLSVLFLQQANIQNWEEYLPKGYKYKKRQSSVIIYSENFVNETCLSFQQKYDKQLNFNLDSVYLKSKDHLFISAHLSSKNINIQQANKMYQVLDLILDEYKNLNIIIGMDANHFIRQHKNFNRFPTDKNGITTRKKRTYLQVQFNKANKLIEEVKDLIVTNREIIKGSINSVDKKNLDLELIPNDGHPYDHFLVKGTVIIHINKTPTKKLK